MAQNYIEVKINTQSVDEAMEKVNRLVELLREASDIISSLSDAKLLEP